MTKQDAHGISRWELLRRCWLASAFGAIVGVVLTFPGVLEGKPLWTIPLGILLGIVAYTTVGLGYFLTKEG